MSRAKRRAGVPLDLIRPKANSKIPRPVGKRKTELKFKDEEQPTKLSPSPSGWMTAGLAKRTAERRKIVEDMSKEGMKQQHHVGLGRPRVLEQLTPRQPAGLAERMVKVSRTIKQPENPHLLRVAVLGAANAGKSTLVNAIVGEDVSVVSGKAHTTRDRVLAVLTEANHQVVFLDTPGVVPDNRHAKMNRTLVTTSWRSLDEADHVILLVDGHWALSSHEKKADMLILDRLRDLNIPTTLIFNKMDLIDYDENELAEVSTKYESGCPVISKTLYVSALDGEGLDILKKELLDASKPKPWIYPPEQKSDMPALKRAEELIRVEFFKRLHQYIPYMLKQENVGWTETEDGVLRIDQNVYVERESQQRIVVGANGAVINRVVSDARAQISKAFNRPVKLFIQVKTKKR
ncbi:P-loop containing nucleoside triphosphate hydrolase protein [Zychaea mexicana]|uniref:P-loop containing nucleoside triphosphate hydrolase protein n=1 Tax=Zychaea mexicana TaxID=64656 RepID=UPI0022FE1822|nr:P-loop containing nucleoside triphosphate hydrolase protein [Zychaea mexicana]KAI9499556.1 P-loop containing nucleoside triphosphate hydrolase protein [Zychaea mexicana]